MDISVSSIYCSFANLMKNPRLTENLPIKFPRTLLDPMFRRIVAKFQTIILFRGLIFSNRISNGGSHKK